MWDIWSPLMHKEQVVNQDNQVKRHLRVMEQNPQGSFARKFLKFKNHCLWVPLKAVWPLEESFPGAFEGESIKSCSEKLFC